MKIVYFGSDVYLSCFEYLAQEHEVLALYTYHNGEDYFTEYAIVARARALGIPVHYDRISEEEVIRFFREEHCDLLFAAEYDRLLPIPQSLPELRGINTHASLLPQGRSYYPIESAMEQGLALTGVTMHKLTNTVDCGDILAQREIPIEPDCDSVDIYLRCAAHAREMLKTILSDLEGCWTAAVPATGPKPYWPRPTEERRTLTHTITRADSLHIFRRFNKMTLVTLQGQPYYVTAMLPGIAMLPDNEPSEIAVAADRFIYRLSDGHLRLNVEPLNQEAHL